jgi:hypothetical protein
MRSDELTFEEGAVIDLISTPNEGWWEGRIGMGIGLGRPCFISSRPGDYGLLHLNTFVGHMTRRHAFWLVPFAIRPRDG